MMRARLLVVLLAQAMLTTAVWAERVTLITAEEAKLPPVKTSARRAIARGPEIKIESPMEGQSVRSPLRLRLVFEPHGGSRIDLDSVEIRYLRSQAIDLTPRMSKFIKANGILIDEAVVPVGDHDIEITVRDQEERETRKVFRLSVQP